VVSSAHQGGGELLRAYRSEQPLYGYYTIRPVENITNNISFLSVIVAESAVVINFLTVSFRTGGTKEQPPPNGESRVKMASDYLHCPASLISRSIKA